jgi:hypothetical protein
MVGHAGSPQPLVIPAMQKDLADVPGREIVMLTVEHPPAALEHMHRHDAYAFVYVLEGSIVEGVRGGKEVTLTPGTDFFEGPDGCGHGWAQRERDQAGKVCRGDAEEGGLLNSVVRRMNRTQF